MSHLSKQETKARAAIRQIQESVVAEEATGCHGAGNYRKYANAHGYKYVEVLDWTSSAGDWQFIVSKNGKVWYVMIQENNYPRAGFTRTIDTSEAWAGTAEEVLQDIYNAYCTF